MKLAVFSTISKDKHVDGNDAVFAVTPNQQLMALAVRVFLANQRQATSKVKTRSEVNRTKKKWYKQKGTGGARHGARSAHIFVGGGVVHGPTGEQNYSLKMTKSQRQLALRSALSAQAAQITVCDDVMQLDGKTASAAKLIARIAGADTKVLVVSHEPQPEMTRSLRNLENVLMESVYRLNTYQVLMAGKIIMTSEAIKLIEQRVTMTGITSQSEDAAESTSTPVKKSAAPKKSSVAKVEKAPAKKAEAKSAKPAAKKPVAKAAKPTKAKTA
jgi:large subunit ribosomal protein L4